MTLEEGTHRVGVFARAACTVCNHHVLLDGSRIDRSEAMSWRYREVATDVPAGDHVLQIGLHADVICNGTFRAWSDDVRVFRSVDPAPTPTVDASAQTTECY